MNHFKSFVFGFAIACLTACGGDDGDDRPVNTLSDDDYVSLCEDQEASLSDDDKDGLVGFSCLLAEAFQTACDQTRLDACIAAGYESEACTPPGADDEIRMCEATVDEFQACADAQIDTFHMYSDATCADLQGEQPATPAACATLMEKCPELFESN